MDSAALRRRLQARQHELEHLLAAKQHVIGELERLTAEQQRIDATIHYHRGAISALEDLVKHMDAGALELPAAVGDQGVIGVNGGA